MENSKILRMGMIGGGPESFIGSIHRLASNMDGLIRLVSGTFSSSYEKSLQMADQLNIDKSRIYENFEQMLEIESKLPNDQKVHFICICTPNHLHYPITKLAIKNNFNIILDKPLCMNLDEAYELEKLINEYNVKFCITYTYTGYPLIKEARHLIKSGKIGKLRKVVVEYPQGWLSHNLEKSGNKQAEWRNDPKRAGDSCCLGDIGTHAFNLLEYVTCLNVVEVCSDITTFVEDRILDDDASILLRLEDKVKGILHASQILSGEENNLKIRVWGELGGIEWNQNDCNSLILKWLDKPNQIYRAGCNYNYLSDKSKKNCRTPGGHPEGYIEAFANIYRNFAYDITNHNIDKEIYDYPGIKDGIRGMLFIKKSLESNISDQKWVKFEN